MSPNAEKSRKVEKVEKDEPKTTIVKEIEKIEDPNQNGELKIPTPKKVHFIDLALKYYFALYMFMKLDTVHLLLER